MASTADYSIKQGESLIPAATPLEDGNGDPIDLTDPDWLVTGQVEFQANATTSARRRDLIFTDEDLAQGYVRPTLHWSDSDTASMAAGMWKGDARIYRVSEDRPLFTATFTLEVQDSVTPTPEG